MPKEDSSRMNTVQFVLVAGVEGRLLPIGIPRVPPGAAAAAQPAPRAADELAPAGEPHAEQAARGLQDDALHGRRLAGRRRRHPLAAGAAVPEAVVPVAAAPAAPLPAAAVPEVAEA